MGRIGAGGLDDPVGVLMKGSEPVLQPGGEVPQLLVRAGWRKANGGSVQLWAFPSLALCPSRGVPPSKPCPRKLPSSHHRNSHPTLITPKGAAVTGRICDGAWAPNPWWLAVVPSLKPVTDASANRNTGSCSWQQMTFPLNSHPEPDAQE